MIQTILYIFGIFISFTAAAPANDDPCDATLVTPPIPTTAVTIVVPGQDTSLANPEPFPSCGTTNDGAGSIWFHIPGQIQDLTVSTCETEGGTSDYDSKLSIFQPDTCGCIDCEDPSSFICVNGNDDSCSDGGSVLRSTVSVSGTYCDLYVVLHGWNGAEGTAAISFTYTAIDQSEENPCPDCGKSFAPTKGECEECLSWNSYLDTLCATDLAIQPVDFEDLLSRENNCLDGFICLLDDGPGSVVTFTSDRGCGGGGCGDDDDDLTPEATIRKGICVAEDGISIETESCETDENCPTCMRCCADIDGNNKQCKRSSGDICGLTFEGKGPCCCPEYTCKGNECVTPSPTHDDNDAGDDDAENDDVAGSGDDDNDDEQQFYAAQQMLNAENNENENVNSVIAMLNKTLMALWSMIGVIIIGVMAMVIFGCVYLKKSKGTASFTHHTHHGNHIENV